MPTKAPTHKPRPVKAKTHGRQDRQQRRALHTGSRTWRLQRERVLVRDLYTCKHCGRYGDQVDHIHGDADRHVDDEALQTLCLPCHSRKTATEQAGKTYATAGCDAQGNPRQPNEHWR